MRSILVDDDGELPVWYTYTRLVNDGFASSRAKDLVKAEKLPPPVKDEPGVMQSACRFYGASVRHMHRNRIKQLMDAERRAEAAKAEAAAK